jgi:hypothetical protein
MLIVIATFCSLATAHCVDETITTESTELQCLMKAPEYIVDWMKDKKYREGWRLAKWGCTRRRSGQDI